MSVLVPAGFVNKNEQCDTIENVLCPNCGNITSFIKLKNTTTGTVIFIPVAKTTNAAAVICTGCKSVFDVRKKDFSHIRSSADVLQAIQNCRDDKVKERTKYDAGFSSKKQTVAVLLAFLLTTYGAPFFYLGKPLYGIACLAASMFSAVFMCFPVLFAIVLGGFVFAFMIAAGKVKDKEGKYIASKKQQEYLMNLPKA